MQRDLLCQACRVRDVLRRSLVQYAVQGRSWPPRLHKALRHVERQVAFLERKTA